MLSAEIPHWVFATLILILALWQRKWGVWGIAALAAEFGLVAIISQAGGHWPRLMLLLPYALLFTLDFRYYDRLGWAPDKNTLRFALREPENTRAVLASEFGWRGWMTLVATIGAAALSAMAPGSTPEITTLLLAMACLGILTAAAIRGAGLPPVPNMLRAVCAALKPTGERTELGVPGRLSLPRDIRVASPQLNILLVVCESMCKRVLHSQAGREAAPRYHAFLRGEAAGLVDFPYALANSSSSDIAYASLFTGLSPDASWERFHRNPLIWSAAKAKGYRTSLYTSQSLRWRNLDRFLLDATLDRAVYREALGAPAINDLAMDDRVINRIAIDELTREGGAFCAVVNYNMLHAPFATYGESDPPRNKTATERYLISLRLFDACFGDLLDALAASGKLEHTAIFFTADHGERPELYDRPHKRRLPERLDDFNLDTLAIPFWVRLPEAMVPPDQTRQLLANARRTVANMDLYPTILDLLGYGRALRIELSSGHSLLKTVPAGRSIVMLNTGEFRQWACEPFAIARDGWLLMFHDVSRSFELLRLDDPKEADVWRDLSAQARSAWLAEVAGRPILGGILAQRRLGFLPPPPRVIAQHYDALASLGRESELHRLNNWGLFSLADWEAMSLRTAAFIGIEKGDSVFEAGCGAGAFLDVLARTFGVRVAGVDMAVRLVEIAKHRLPGEFWVGDIQDMSFAASNRYDKVVSHGVFLYLPSLEAVERAALEMVRLAKPGGVVYIGVLNDPDRIVAYRSAHRPSGNAFARRDFWLNLGLRHSLDVEILDQDRIYSKSEGYDGHARLRYSVRMRKPVAVLDSVGQGAG